MRLAPVLAQLEAVEGVREARVDESGRRFLFYAAGPRDRLTDRAIRVLEAAGYSAHAEDVEPMLESLRAGQSWRRFPEMEELSKKEAGTLSRRWADTAGKAVGLTSDETEQVREQLRGEFLERLRRVHAAGGATKDRRLEIEFATLAEEVVKRCAGFLSEEKQRGLADSLRAQWRP